ncbi:MAG TPA: iron-containing redox enzyme family protein [Caulobacteraceae bacterium]|nr:iron-containing redox enzyme family protein [Caulobacteraceae bacterium]
MQTPQIEAASLQRLHRELAHWNHRRLAVGMPSIGWEVDLAEEAGMRVLEGRWVEGLRQEVAARAAEAPGEPEAFVAWFEDLKQSGPGQGDPLFAWLSKDASLEDLCWFLTQEAAGEAGFEDLVALAQVKMPDRPKLELARNYWDEMGRGSMAGMHGPMLASTVRGLGLEPTIDTTVWQSLALANTMTAFATTRRYAFHAIGALGVVELTAPTRVSHVADGLKRLGCPPQVRKYFALHAHLDVEHSRTWNEEVLKPLVAEQPDCARYLAEGALMRLVCGARCFDAYRAHLWKGAAVAIAAE